MSSEFKKYRKQSCVVIEFQGSINSAEKKDELIELFGKELKEGSEKFIFDLENAEYFNSEGINVIVRLLNDAKRSEAQIAFAAVPARIQELLDIIKLNSTLRIYPSVDDGIHSMN